MKIIQVIRDLDLNHGGPSRSLPTTCIGLKKQGACCEVLTYQTKYPNTEGLIANDIKVSLVQPETKFINKFRSSNIFRTETFDNSIVHIHNLWTLMLHNVAKDLRKKNIPYVWSPRGALKPWALGHKRLKKALAMLMYQRNDLVNAACIHATAESEAMQIRKLGFTNPIAVIPNPINIENYPLKSFEENKRGKKTLMFLSRVHPQKGLPMLFEAFRGLSADVRNDWEIVIVGDGDPEYPLDSFKSMVISKYADLDIKIVGPKYGNDKINCLHNADLFILPTYSENFGMAIVEAMACGVPVITTTGAPWSILKTENVGWWVEPTVDGISTALNDALVAQKGTLITKGLKSREIAISEFSIDFVTKKYNQLYNWIGGITDIKPEFVHILKK